MSTVLMRWDGGDPCTSVICSGTSHINSGVSFVRSQFVALIASTAASSICIYFTHVIAFRGIALHIFLPQSSSIVLYPHKRSRSLINLPPISLRAISFGIFLSARGRLRSISNSYTVFDMTH